MDGPENNSMWQSIYPWVTGLLTPVGIGLGWMLRFIYITKRQHDQDDQDERDRDDEYRLRDRKLLSDEQQAAYARLVAERDRFGAEADEARAELAKARVECAQAWHAAYSVHDWAREQRHLANGVFQQMTMAWKSGEKPSDVPWQLPPVPPVESFGKPQN